MDTQPTIAEGWIDFKDKKPEEGRPFFAYYFRDPWQTQIKISMIYCVNKLFSADIEKIIGWKYI